MRWSFGIGRIAGIRIQLHVTFLLFVVWMAASQGFASGDFGRALETGALLLLVFGCVLLHELGHALTARRYGIRTRDIVLLPIGGIARLERMPEKPSQELIVAIAGPLVNVAIAAALVGVFALLGVRVESLDLNGGILMSLLVVNVAMVVFNLIPAFPMDGGRVLRALLAMRLPYVKATRIASGVGQVVALGFGAVGLFAGNFMLMLIALFVFLAAGEERALVQNRLSLAGIGVRDAMLTEFHVLDPADALQRAVDFLMAGNQQDFPVLEAGAPVGMLTRRDLVRALQRDGASATVGDAITRDEEYADAGEPLDSVLRRMRERARTALPVLERGRLVGLLTLENIGDLLVVSEALRRHERSA
jgi:Zn-dependent protease/predicted transcriptional regulator